MISRNVRVVENVALDKCETLRLKIRITTSYFMFDNIITSLLSFLNSYFEPSSCVRNKMQVKRSSILVQRLNDHIHIHIIQRPSLYSVLWPLLMRPVDIIQNISFHF